MCGITGIWAPIDNRTVDFNDIVRMTEKIRHRGPNGSAHFIDGSLGLAFGHARLSINDLDEGKQPFVNKEYGLIVCVNGEFYDFKRIRAKLSSLGYRFQTKSDSEIVLHLYHHFGMKFTDYLRGEFALSIYDLKSKKLVLARDRFGIRPLFYTIKNNALFFASEMKSLFSSKSIEPSISEEATVNQLCQIMLPGQTLFKNIRSLKAGHLLIVDMKNKMEAREHEYWDMKYPKQHERNSVSESTIIDELQEQLIDAVSVRMVADVPIACYLSGGLDSCTTYSLASILSQEPITAFTIGFDDKTYDETRIAKRIKAFHQGEHYILPLSHSALYGKNYLKALNHSERTFYNTLGVAKMLMSEFVKEKGFKVVITGEGSDELFGGYPGFKIDYYTQQNKKISLKESEKMFLGSIIPEQPVSHPGFDALIGFTPTWIKSWCLVWASIKNLLSDNFKRKIGDYDPFEALSASLNKDMLVDREPLDQTQYIWIKTMLEGQILNWGGDRVDMANALETRPPFLDHKLAEFSVNIPPSMRIKDGIEKWVLREAVKEIIPQELYERTKFPFMAPPPVHTKGIDSHLKDLINIHMDSDTLKEMDIIDPNKLSSFVTHEVNSGNPSRLTRLDIILNHMLGIHGLQTTYA